MLWSGNHKVVPKCVFIILLWKQHSSLCLEKQRQFQLDGSHCGRKALWNCGPDKSVSEFIHLTQTLQVNTQFAALAFKVINIMCCICHLRSWLPPVRFLPHIFLRPCLVTVELQKEPPRNGHRCHLVHTETQVMLKVVLLFSNYNPKWCYPDAIKKIMLRTALTGIHQEILSNWLISQRNDCLWLRRYDSQWSCCRGFWVMQRPLRFGKSVKTEQKYTRTKITAKTSKKRVQIKTCLSNVTQHSVC